MSASIDNLRVGYEDERMSRKIGTFSVQHVLEDEHQWAGSEILQQRCRVESLVHPSRRGVHPIKRTFFTSNLFFSTTSISDGTMASETHTHALNELRNYESV